MTETQYLDFVDHSIQQLEQQLAEAKRQRDELRDYTTGKRRSRHKLGSVYYIQWGRWLDDIRMTTERWEARYLD
jgi:hypothetical protein